MTSLMEGVQAEVGRNDTTDGEGTIRGTCSPNSY